MTMRLDAWLSKSRYLPPFMRDFHAQKDLFKAIHEAVKVNGYETTKNVDWVAGMCYVIDVFLWFMALHGYTLQRTRTNVDAEFRDIQTTVREAADRRSALSTKALIGAFKGEKA
ncbi:hypothetical protein C0Q88_07505 [Ralstonia pickettii]|uniref:Uncharacterized protein n=1 Tax=Ralstonia pickettii TaxID=329 RepID=A0A2N4TXS5_RALPI|nr:hypothetical protein [Ralstonia pickettii]PLC44516.1 hypothetical protein C0Q88_07505 [Ralstonia pickettii]